MTLKKLITLSLCLAHECTFPRKGFLKTRNNIFQSTTMAESFSYVVDNEINQPRIQRLQKQKTKQNKNNF